jgi:hypothetical protein
MKMKKWIVSTVGFLLSSCIFVGMVLFDFYMNKWSGNSPLNKLYFLPISVFVYVLILFVIKKLKNYDGNNSRKTAVEFLTGFLIGLLPLGLTSL